jgi:hypothetical protein
MRFDEPQRYKQDGGRVVEQEHAEIAEEVRRGAWNLRSWQDSRSMWNSAFILCDLRVLLFILLPSRKF